MDDQIDIPAIWSEPKRNPLYVSLYDLVDAWDDERRWSPEPLRLKLEHAIVAHARVLLAMPDATFEELWQWLHDHS